VSLVPAFFFFHVPIFVSPSIQVTVFASTHPIPLGKMADGFISLNSSSGKTPDKIDPAFAHSSIIP